MKLFTGCYYKIKMMVAHFIHILGIYIKTIESATAAMNEEDESRMQSVSNNAQALLVLDYA